MTPLIDVRGLTQHFGGLAAVSNFDLQVRPGELVGIIGPNGAGKTTIFNLLTGIYRPTAGSMRFDGVDLVGRPPHEIARLGISRTFQTIRLFKDLTVLDNVRVAAGGRAAYGPVAALCRASAFREEEARIRASSVELLRRFELDNHANAHARHLSYGLQRRLELARALATKPRLLLLDEPAAGINRSEGEQLMELIRWVRQEFQLTILLIEHSMRIVMGLCERLIVLDFGTTIAEGAPEAIRVHPKVLEAYLGEEPGA